MLEILYIVNIPSMNVVSQANQNATLSEERIDKGYLTPTYYCLQPQGT